MRHPMGKNAGRHDFITCLRSERLPAAMGLCVFMLCIPFSTALIPGDSIFDIRVTHDQMKWRMIGDDFPVAVQGFAVLLGFLFGLRIFRFALDPRQSLQVFSLPLTRNRLCINRLLSGLVLLAASVLIPVGASLFFNLIAIGGYSGMIAAALWLFCGIFVTSGIAFVITALGVLLSGTRVEAVFCSSSILAAPFVLSFAADAFQRHLRWGNPFGAVPWLGNGPVEPALTEIFESANPVLFFFDALNTQRIFYRTPADGQPPAIAPAILVIWIILLLIVSALCLLAMNQRPAELAGFSGKRPNVSRWMSMIPLLFLSAFLFFYAGSVGTEFGLCVAGALFLAGVILREQVFIRRGGEASAGGRLFRRGPGEMCRGGAALFHNIVLPLGLFLMFSLGAGWGYGAGAGLPSADAIRSVAVSVAGAPNYLGIPSLASSTENSYYFSAQPVFTAPDDVKLAMELHRKFIAGGKGSLAGDKEDFSRTVVPCDIQFDYTLSDGGIRRWYYDRASMGQLADMLRLEDRAPVRESMKQALTGGGDTESPARHAFANGDVYLSDMTFRDVFRVRMTQAVRDGLLASIADDMLKKTAAQRYFPKNDAIALLMFTSEGESDLEFFSWHPGNSFVHIYEEDEKTLAFLRAQGLWFDEDTTDLSAASDPKEVDRLILQEYDPYLGINPPAFPQSLYFMSYRSVGSDHFRVKKDFGKINEVLDPQKRAEMIPRLRSVAFLSGPGHLAAVKYKGDDHWVYQFLPKGEGK